jgi:hypothetical protein
MNLLLTILIFIIRLWWFAILWTLSIVSLVLLPVVWLKNYEHDF